MSRLSELTSILAAEVALDRWDASPSVGVMVELRDEFRLVPLRLSEHFWKLGDPASMLPVIARVLSEMNKPGKINLPMQWPVGFSLAGVAFFTEGWGLDLTGLPPKVKARALKLSEERGLSTHPNRTELKMIVALDIDGGRYSTSWTRGAPGPVEMVADKPGTELSGRVIDGLGLILHALQSAGL